jgi:uncharacterized repeat protein (TIGR01451 family)
MTRDFSITKDVIGASTYRPGDNIQFAITITNTGQTKIDQLQFFDRYNPNLFTFFYIEGRRGNGSTVNLTPYLEFTYMPDGFRQIRVADLTVPLGDLEVGQSYYLTAVFIARSVSVDTQTCNVAIGDDGYTQKQDNACVTIIYVRPRPTDK